MRSIPRTIVEYVDADGNIPFRNWLIDLKDRRAQVTIEARLTRVRMGNLGNCRTVGNGVFELKIDFGPGYRVYFGQDGNKLVVLLVGGDKRTQTNDIRRAKEFWNDYTGE